MKEIERKFLVDRKKVVKFINSVTDIEILNIEQFYISLDPEVRIRRTISKEGTSYVKTTKTGSGLEREEIEIESSFEEYESLILASSMIINKIRYVIEDIEIDLYRNGLAIMEKEYSSVTEAKEDIIDFDFITKEVTGDTFFSNAEIAQR